MIEAFLKEGFSLAMVPEGKIHLGGRHGSKKKNWGKEQEAESSQLQS